jgi:hypothetical protein
MLKPPGTKRLKLKTSVLLSDAAFEFNFRRYTTAAWLSSGRQAEDAVTRENDALRSAFSTGPAAAPFRTLVNAAGAINAAVVRRCRLTVSKPVLKAPTISALDTII